MALELNAGSVECKGHLNGLVVGVVM